MSFQVAILASGNGTDLQAILEEMAAGKLPDVSIKMVVSDHADAPALEKARQAGVRAEFVDPTGLSREEYDQKLVNLVGDVDLICLTGFMRILTPIFVQAYEGIILNVHPALLPKYGGKGWYGMKVHEAVIANGDDISGMTIHIVDENVDEGTYLIQKVVPVEAGETPESLKEKVQALEKEWYPEAIRLFQHGLFS